MSHAYIRKHMKMTARATTDPCDLYQILFHLPSVVITASLIPFLSTKIFSFK